MNLEDLLCSNSPKDELFPDCYNTQPRDLAELFLCPDAIPGQQRIPTGSRVICNPPVMDTDEDCYAEMLEASTYICPQCSGSGEGLHEGTLCNACKGSGEVKPHGPTREDYEANRADALNDAAKCDEL